MSRRPKARFEVHLELPFDSNSPRIRGLHSQSKVSLLRTRIAEDVGILPETYHLTYLDAAPLEDSASLHSLDIVSGATLRLCPWKIWSDLLKAAYLGNTAGCFSCSMDIAGDSAWSRHCAWCALYVASHRGHYALVAKLLEGTSVAINLQSPSGWTALHAAARNGQWKVLCILVDKGADVRITDSKGLTPFDLARQYSHKKCEQSLNFCMWGLQKHQVVQERQYDYSARKGRMNAFRQAHQYRDSTLATWRKGPCGQLYMMQTPNPVTINDVAKFEMECGVKGKIDIDHIDRTKRGKNKQTCGLPPIRLQSASPITQESPLLPQVEEGTKLDFNYGWFDPLRSQLLIPPTHDILRYANPSSCQLRPRSVLNPDGYKVPLSPFSVQNRASKRTEGKASQASHMQKVT